MKRIIIFVFIMIVTTISAYSLDTEKAKKALAKGDYIPALMDYGFKEKQIKAWRFAGKCLSDYFKVKRKSNHTLTQTIQSIKTCIPREISEKDMIGIEQFLNDIHSFWLDEEHQKEETTRQKIQAEEERKTQERERYKQEQEQYAKTFGLITFVEGIMETIAEITPKNFDLAKKVMIIPNDFDQLYSVQNIVNGHVIYSAVSQGVVHQVALVLESGRAYLANSPLDLNSIYKIQGTMRFTRALGGAIDIIVISRLGALR